VGTSIACLFLIAIMPAITTARLAPIPMISTGIVTAHASEDDVVPVWLVDVLLLAVVVAVVAWDPWMTVIISPWVRQGSERGIKTAKVMSSNELILKCDIPPSTGEQSFLERYVMEPRVKALSDRPNSSHGTPKLHNWPRGG